MKDYLEYVRGSGRYDSEYKESYFEWREDVPDGLEVSTLAAAAPRATAVAGDPAVSDAA